jgi:hypothetical protein
VSPGVGLVGSGSVQVEVGGFELTKHLAVLLSMLKAIGRSGSLVWCLQPQN